MSPIKLVSFNVNGIRSVLSKELNGKKHDTYIEHNSLAALMDEQKADILCLQEIRCSDTLDIEGTLKLKERGYYIVKRNCSKVKAGYSGTLVISRIQHLDVIQDFPHLPATHELNGEGRLITVEYPSFVLINAYVPNSKPDLSRLKFRTDEWEPAIRLHIKSMEKKYKKPIVYCADFNVAPKEIDLHNPKGSKGKHGFTIEEREAFAKLLKECDLVDSYRHLYPNKVEYSWWSNFANSREKNKGWRIDMFLVSTSIVSKIKQAEIYGGIKASDHAPVTLELAL